MAGLKTLLQPTKLLSSTVSARGPNVPGKKVSSAASGTPGTTKPNPSNWKRKMLSQVVTRQGTPKKAK